MPIISEANIIAQLEFELTYYDITVQYVNHYPRKLPTPGTIRGNRSSENVSKTLSHFSGFSYIFRNLFQLIKVIIYVLIDSYKKKKKLVMNYRSDLIDDRCIREIKWF